MMNILIAFAWGGAVLLVTAWWWLRQQVPQESSERNRLKEEMHDGPFFSNTGL